MINCIIIFGPTSSGKTGFAINLAEKMNGEILSMDSRQVFKYMDIGTGKDLQEYKNIPHHLINIKIPTEEFSVYQFQKHAHKALITIHNNNRLPILCGGTGHYLKALIEDYSFKKEETNKNLAENLEDLTRDELYEIIKSNQLWDDHHWANDSKRRMARTIEKLGLKQTNTDTLSFKKQYRYIIFSPQVDTDFLRKKIKTRLESRLKEGLIEEVRALIEKHNIPLDRIKKFGLEYKYSLSYIEKNIGLDELTEKLYIQNCRYAKRQRTFLRYLEKQGHQIFFFKTFEELHEKSKQFISI